MECDLPWRPCCGCVLRPSARLKSATPRGRVPWYGTWPTWRPVIPAGRRRDPLRTPVRSSPSIRCRFIAAMLAAAVFMVLNLVLVSVFLALRTGHPVVDVFVGDLQDHAGAGLPWRPLAWLMAIIYGVQWWATAAVRRSAVLDADGLSALRRDARHVHPDHRRPGRGRQQRDPFTAKHSHRVKEIAVDIGPGHAGERRRARSPRVGRPSCTTSARSAFPTTSY